MENSKIAWTDHTFNPWWGCSHAGSPGCDYCYAKREATRFGDDCWGPGRKRKTFGEKHWDEPYKWNREAKEAGKPAIVFCGSMCDVFDPEAPEKLRCKLFEVIGDTSRLFWMLLTKRPERMMGMLPGLWQYGIPSHVALGVTVETQADTWRIKEMLRLKAKYNFVSHEPALGKVIWPSDFMALGSRALVITGGESGNHARPMHPKWARYDRDQCTEYGVRYCFKQWGEWRPAVKGDRWGKDTLRLIRENGYQISMGETFDPVRGDIGMFRAGKKAAGRELDGQIWDERLI